MKHTSSRRDFLRLAGGGMAAAFAAPSCLASVGAGDEPAGPIEVRVTAGSRRYAPDARLEWRRASGPGHIVLDATRTYQEVLGFGAAFTDAACYNLNRLNGESRERLLRELFAPDEMGFSTCRICVGSSDYSTAAYSYDDGAPDPELAHFSIEHDRDYILPILRAARRTNPDLFLLASPWSPPGWMKFNGTMLGGSMRKKYFGPYAKYLAKFLQAYAAEGVPVNAITPQNEVDTDQDGNMPACLWGQEYEIEFIARHLGPELAANGIPTKIWMLDHNYDLWGRALCELGYPDVNRFVDGIAWHGYAGEPSAMTRVHEAFPGKHTYWTEGGPEYTSPTYSTDWTGWSATFTAILRNWSRCIIGWNLALDERGRPNIGPFSCGGIITIDSQSGSVTRSGMYWALTHYSRAIRRGARRFESRGELAGVSHVAFANPDKTQVAILTNQGQERRAQLRLSARTVEVTLPADSVTTLTWH